MAFARENIAAIHTQFPVHITAKQIPRRKFIAFTLISISGFSKTGDLILSCTEACFGVEAFGGSRKTMPIC